MVAGGAVADDVGAVGEPDTSDVAGVSQVQQCCSAQLLQGQHCWCYFWQADQTLPEAAEEQMTSGHHNGGWVTTLAAAQHSGSPHWRPGHNTARHHTRGRVTTQHVTTLAAGSQHSGSPHGRTSHHTDGLVTTQHVTTLAAGSPHSTSSHRRPSHHTARHHIGSRVTTQHVTTPAAGLAMLPALTNSGSIKVTLASMLYHACHAARLDFRV